MNRSISPHAPFRCVPDASSRTAVRVAIPSPYSPHCERRPKENMGTSRATAILLAKELRLEFRTREILTATVVFCLIVIMLFSYVIEPTAAESRRYGPGLLWIAF